MSETLEKIAYIPVWFILFSLIFATGAYFYKQDLMADIADTYFSRALNEGGFTSEDVDEMLDRLERLGFDRGDTEVSISPSGALNGKVDRGTLVELVIDPHRKAFISTLFEKLNPGGKAVRYYYRRVGKSEEYLD
ncbi:MAG: hypothetical protein QME73_14130 [Bacillota bacterium]|nr:hypothetical protein [Bacillota bacterium]NPV44835.1 hypothetical protein [Bacillota bacterium]